MAKGGKLKPRKKARDFGDNPHIRGGKDRTHYHKGQHWERRYRREKRKKR